MENNLDDKKFIFKEVDKSNILIKKRVLCKKLKTEDYLVIEPKKPIIRLI